MQQTNEASLRYGIVAGYGRLRSVEHQHEVSEVRSLVDDLGAVSKNHFGASAHGEEEGYSNGT